MPYIHTCNRCKRKATSQDGSRPTCKQKACRNSRKGGMMSRGMFVPPCASCGGELVETPSGLLTCFSCSGNGMMTLDVAKKKYHEKMRPQYEADARRHEQKMAERTALIAKLPFALPVEGIQHLYTLDDRAGWFRVCNEGVDGAIKAVIVNPEAKRRGYRKGTRRVGFVRPAKRIGSITIPKDKSNADG